MSEIAHGAPRERDSICETGRYKHCAPTERSKGLRSWFIVIHQCPLNLGYKDPAQIIASDRYGSQPFHYNVRR
jgi:hypothetical protein